MLKSDEPSVAIFSLNETDVVDTKYPLDGVWLVGKLPPMLSQVVPFQTMVSSFSRSSGVSETRLKLFQLNPTLAVRLPAGKLSVIFQYSFSLTDTISVEVGTNPVTPASLVAAPVKYSTDQVSPAALTSLISAYPNRPDFPTGKVNPEPAAAKVFDNLPLICDVVDPVAGDTVAADSKSSVFAPGVTTPLVRFSRLPMVTLPFIIIPAVLFIPSVNILAVPVKFPVKFWGVVPIKFIAEEPEPPLKLPPL